MYKVGNKLSGISRDINWTTIYKKVFYGNIKVKKKILFYIYICCVLIHQLRDIHHSDNIHYEFDPSGCINQEVLRFPLME